MTNPSIASDDFERAKRVIAEQGEGLTLEQVTAQRDLWIMSASEWEGRLVAAESALSQLTREVDAKTEALEYAKAYLAGELNTAAVAEIQAIEKRPLRLNKGASVPDQAFAVPATPANAVDGPSGFDPSRVPTLYGASAESYGVAVWVGRMQAMKSHLRIIADHLPCDTGMERWLHNQIRAAQAEASGYIRDCCPLFGDALDAIATEARRAETEDTGSVHEGAGPKDIAQ